MKLPGAIKSIIVAASALAMQAAIAGVQAPEPAPKPAASSSQRNVIADASKKDKPAYARHYLRCWQYGKLIFEEPLAAVPAELDKQGVVFRSHGEGAGSVYLMERNGATCIVK